jgi:two-component system, response regulator PdtaR
MQTRRPAAVLVVEDDLLVRDVIVEVLKEAGFAACEAANAEEALRALAKRSFDAVVTDIDMPGEIDGLGLARRIGELKPEVGVILTSGRAGRILPPGTRFLVKPFTVRSLLQSVAALIDERLYAAS